MNFDGTLKESDTLLRPHPKAIEAQKAADKSKSDDVHPPPVRVIVSYAQEEEGKHVYCRGGPSKRTWICIITALVFLTVGGVSLYFILRPPEKKPNFDNGQDHKIPSRPEYEKPIEENLDKYVTNLVKHHYHQQIGSNNRTNLKIYFNKEWERLKTQDLDGFLVQLGPGFPLNLPLTEDNRLDVLASIREEIQQIQKWLAYWEKEEEELLNYIFQKNKKWTNPRFKNVNNWKGKQLEILQNLWSNYVSNTVVEVRKESVTFSNTVLLLSEVVTTLKQMQPNITMVTMVASTVYIDSNFTQNVVLAIIAPEWKIVSRDVVFDLSGISYVSNKTENADGAPGRPGGHGGLFLGVGEFNTNEITVKVDGGNGENGHKGMDGHSASKISKEKQMKQLQIHKEEPKCVVPAQESSYNLNGDPVLYLSIYPDEVCAYKGGPGGPSGQAGRGGLVIFITSNGSRIVKGLDGKDGLPGHAGIDGRTLNEFCNYTALLSKAQNKTNVYEWSQITNIVCTNKTTSPLLNSTIQLQRPFVLPQPPKKIIFREAIQSFSKIARRSYIEGGTGPLFLLLQTLEQTPLIAEFTNLTEIFNESMQITNDLANSAVLNSFLNKVRSLLNYTSDIQEKQALKYLRAAIWSRSTALQYGIGDFYIVDIEKYVDQLLEEVNKSNYDLGKRYNDSRQQLIKDINEKLEELKYIVKKAIIPMLSTENRNTQFLALVRTMANATSELIRITTDQLKHILPDLSKLKELILKYEHSPERNTIPPDFPTDKNMTNEEIKKACIKLNIAKEDCLDEKTYIKWKTYASVDKKILDSFHKLFEADSKFIITEIENILWSIRTDLRSDLIENKMASEATNALREMTGEFALLLHRSKNIKQDASFNESLYLLNDGFVFTNSNIASLVSSAKEEILNNQLRIEYQRVFATYQQWAFPYTNTLSQVPLNSNQEEFILGLKAIKDAMVRFQSTITERDANLKRAEFHLGSTTGPFFTWPNSDVKDVIKNLFLGKPVLLRADIHRSTHVPVKQAIKFRTVELAFTGIENRTLQHFAVEMTHMGFSNFFFKNSVYTSIQPSVQLYHSFAHRTHNRPEIFNSVYEKIKKGDITLSPYTTWIVQLQPTNTEASYMNLLPFVNVTNIHLVGTGWYTTDSNRPRPL